MRYDKVAKYEGLEPKLVALFNWGPIQIQLGALLTKASFHLFLFQFFLYLFMGLIDYILIIDS